MAMCVLGGRDDAQSPGDEASALANVPEVQIEELRDAVQALFHARQLLLDCDRAAALQVVGRVARETADRSDEAVVKRLQRQAELARADVQDQRQRCVDLCAALGIDVTDRDADPAVQTINQLSIAWGLLSLPVAHLGPGDQVRAA